MKTLIVAEKPSVAKTIAQIVGAKTSKDGYINGESYIVTWCVGHLLELASPDTYDEKYKKWKLEDLPILPDKFRYIGKKDTNKQLKTILSLIKDTEVTEVINATDAGREGELIFRLVYNHSKSNKPVKRLWISSLEKESITNGLKSMKSQNEYDYLYKAAIARQQADWIVGMNGSRLFSVLYNANLHVGRVQTPTLNMVVERYDAIRKFKKTPFYSVALTCSNRNNDSFIANSQRLNEQDATALVGEVNASNKGTVKTVDSKEKSTKPPELYDLTTLQREANRIFGFTAQQTLNFAQSLYEKKLLTYPRTDSKYITEDMADSTSLLANRVMDKLLFLKDIKEQVNISNIKTVVNNKKVSDHHAIIPTGSMIEFDISTLPRGERDVLYLVSTRLLIAISPKQVYKETVVIVVISSPNISHEFIARGKIVLEKGFMIIQEQYKQSLKSQNKSDEDNTETTGDKTESYLPNLTEGDILAVKPKLEQGFTSPPKPFTEDTLLLAMEKATVNADNEDSDNQQENHIVKTQLGTPATRAAIIEKLIKSGYMERNKKQILPTEKGLNLIKVVPNKVKSPKLTAEWERQLTEVEEGKVDYEEFLIEIKNLSKSIVAENQHTNTEFKDLFPTQPQRGKVKEVIGKCPRCGGDVLEWDKVFSCRDKDCEFALFKESKYFTNKKVKLTKKIAISLLKDGKVFIKGLYSEKKDKTYDATIVLADDGGKYVGFKLEF